MPTAQRRAHRQNWFLLILAVHIWALSFIGARYALIELGPFVLTAARCLLVFVFGLPWLLRQRYPTSLHREWLQDTCPVGLVFGLMLILCTMGLQRSTVSNTSFITTLYVVFVPIMQWFTTGEVPRPILWLALLISLTGTSLMCRVFEAHFNQGDLFTLASSVLAGCHILLITRIGRKHASSLGLNVYQSLWAGLVALPFALLFEKGGLPISVIAAQTWLWLAFLVIVVNLIAFSIQIRAQRVFSPLSVSLVYLMESPLAALMAYFCFAEKMAPLQWLGATLILLSGFFASFKTRQSRLSDID